MDIAIQCRHTEASQAVRETIDEKVTRLARYLDGVDHAEVRLEEQRNPRIAEREICEITLYGNGRVVRAKAAAADVLSAVDRVSDKLQHRMEKLKGKLVSHGYLRRSAARVSGTVS